MSDVAFAAYEAKLAREAQLRAEALPHNKQVLFDTLAAAGIVVVTIAFDGSGDSGQFGQPVAFDAENNEQPVPAAPIIVKAVQFETGTLFDMQTTLRVYLLDLACQLLDEKHSHWEDGEGAQGEFRFALEDRTITLDYNERYLEYDHQEYEF